MGKDEYKAKAGGYKQLSVFGLIMFVLGLFSWPINPFFFLLAPFGFLVMLIGMIGYSYYEGKYRSFSRIRCRFCGGELPENAKFCPVCGRSQV
jgi:hypothetical protein